MAEHKHQQQDLRAGLQHLANRQQDLVPHQGASVLQHQLQVEAHIQGSEQFRQQHQAALIAVQDLERQRLSRQ
jgi:hypothetical protein